MSTSGEKTFSVRCSDGAVLEVEEAMALQSTTMKEWKDSCDCGNFHMNPPLNVNVSSIIMAKVIHYSKFHLKAATNMAVGDSEVPVMGATPDEVKRFDADFMNVDEPTLFQLLMAAKLLGMRSLMDLSCISLRELIRSKTPDQVRAMFNIRN